MPTNLSPEHYQGIGVVVVVWAKLEAHVVRVLNARAGISPRWLSDSQLHSIPLLKAG